MIAVIFELEPYADRASDYFELAADLAPILKAMPGFISVERFQSIASPGRFLSLSFWEDEAAVAAWRAGREHRSAQQRGRTGIFRDYRLRVAQVIRDYGLNEREEAPPDSRDVHG